MCSDLLVGVEHDSEGGADGSWGKVVSELGADESGVSVGGDHLAPDGLVRLAGGGLSLGSVHIGDALAVVPGGRLAVLASLNFHESLIFFLGSLATLESHKKCLSVKSADETNGEIVGN
jgi:hypothetical protein